MNDRIITDKMKDKPAWYKTGDMFKFFIGEHLDGIRFIESQNNSSNRFVKKRY